MKALFIGGTGVISSACSQLAVERGVELFLLNRGESHRAAPLGATLLQGDIRDDETARRILRDRTFDVVVDWIAFVPDHVETDIRLFRGRTEQYIFISSASAYQTPPAKLPVTEETPLINPVWLYSRQKIACEDTLWAAFRNNGFPVTIVRPSHTYDATLLPLHGQYTMIRRMRRNQEVIVPGDGTSIWTLTHNRDFAKGFLGLLGNSNAVGEAFHITSDEWLTWNQIYGELAQAAGVEPKLAHIPSELIAAYDREWGDSLLGDKTHSMIFDNSKIKRFVPDFRAEIPFSKGAREIIAWYDAHPERQTFDVELDGRIDSILSAYKKVWPSSSS